MKKVKIISLFVVLFLIALISKSNASQISIEGPTELQQGATGTLTISFTSEDEVGEIEANVTFTNMIIEKANVEGMNGWSVEPNLANGKFLFLKQSASRGETIAKINFTIPSEAEGTANFTIHDYAHFTKLDYTQDIESVSGSEKNITIIPASPFTTLTGLRIATNPDKTTYKEGEFFDPTGMVVMAQYSNGDEIHTMDFITSPIRALTTSDKVVTVSYTEDNVTKEAYVSITVTKEEDTTTPIGELPHTEAGPTLSELRLDKKPNKVAYVEGDTFDATGMVVTAIFENGYTLEIATSETTITPNKVLTVNDKVIVVSYTAGEVTKEVSIDITVAKKEEANNNAGKTEEKQEKKDNTQVPVEQTPQTGTGKVLVGSMGVCGLIVAASYVLSKKQF